MKKNLKKPIKFIKPIKSKIKKKRKLSFVDKYLVSFLNYIKIVLKYGIK